MDKVARAGQLEQDSWTGQPGQDRQVRPRHLGRDIWDRTTGSRQPKTGRTGQVGMIGNLDRKARK